MPNVAMFDVNPAVDVKSDSPLAMSRPTAAVLSSPQGAGVVVRERAFLGHLILRGNAADGAFRAGVEQALGAPLPTSPGVFVAPAADGEHQAGGQSAQRRKTVAQPVR